MNADQAKRLREPFDGKLVGKLPRKTKTGGTVYLDFVGHAAVTDRLLQVDPGYTFELLKDVSGIPIVVAAGGALEPNHTVGVYGRLTVCGVTREEFGNGGNLKDAVSDALKRCAMRFGVALDLWSKEDLHTDSGDGPADPVGNKDARKTVAAADASPPPETHFKAPTAKPTKAELKKLTDIVGALMDDGDLTNEQLMAAAKTETPWPELAEVLERSVVIDLTERLGRYRNNKKARITTG